MTMSLEGLRTEPLPKKETIKIDPSDSIGAAVEALKVLRLVEDEGELRETLDRDFDALLGQNRTGELYVQAPLTEAEFSLASMIVAIDRYSPVVTYQPIDVRQKLWTKPPTVGYESYSKSEVSRLGRMGDNWRPHARLALSDSQSGRSSSLFFTDHYYDGMPSKNKEATQQELFVAEQMRYEDENPGYNMAPWNTSAWLMMALIRRIKGEPVPTGEYRMPDLGRRRNYEGDSVIGVARSMGSAPLSLALSGGNPADYAGIGLSVGLNSDVSN